MFVNQIRDRRRAETIISTIISAFRPRSLEPAVYSLAVKTLLLLSGLFSVFLVIQLDPFQDDSTIFAKSMYYYPLMFIGCLILLFVSHNICGSLFANLYGIRRFGPLLLLAFVMWGLLSPSSEKPPSKRSFLLVNRWNLMAWAIYTLTSTILKIPEACVFMSGSQPFWDFTPKLELQVFSSLFFSHVCAGMMFTIFSFQQVHAFVMKLRHGW